MVFNLSISLDDAAAEDHRASAVLKAAQAAAIHVSMGRTEAKIVDYNGNTIGHWSITGEAR